jgi:thymidylate kinase
MAHTESLSNQDLTDPRALRVPPFNPATHPFYSALFAALRKHHIRGRALHGEGELLCGLDLAIPRADAAPLGLAFAELQREGYRAVQTVNLSPGRCRLVFARLFAGEIETAMLDLSYEGDVGGAQRPTGSGAFLVFLGPDGVGKTTLLRQLCSALAPMFAAQEIYRWRPGQLLPTQHPARLPHSKPMRGFRRSISYLFFTWADFVSGYLLKTRRLMQTPTLVVFDRYYHDLLIDPKRYRYNGPMWLAGVIGRLVPPDDVFFLVLDADEHSIFARKQQLPVEEIKRQRAAYREFAQAHKNSMVIETDQPLAQCRERALQALLPYLAGKNQRLMSRWSLWPAKGAAEFDCQAPRPNHEPPASPVASSEHNPVFDISL